MIAPARVVCRVLFNTELDPLSGCLVSTYSTGSHGYAQVGWHEAGARTVTLAHRVVASAILGAIPEGTTVDHLCKNRRCVNPGHLRVISNFENARRTNGRDWDLGTCANGHSNSELTTALRGKDKPRKVCRVCQKEWHERYRQKKARSKRV